ncbi:MAG: class I adenylate-forming enzyme family protein [Bacteroidota bacterium]
MPTQIETSNSDAGWKQFTTHLSKYPFIGPLLFGDKKDLILADQEETLQSLVSYLTNNRDKYKQFLRQKRRHPSFDIYALFHPFNEAFKALFPFVDYLKQQLKDGDTILNLWDRSGCSATMLAGWFPKQHIVTVWEGDKDILGYRGFDYWMSRERRNNHTVLFADFYRPLPLESASVSAVIGFDVLHRFNQPELLTELLRIATPKAPLIFPHVHLTNSMPEPFFERGCRQLHGTDYQYLFDTLAPVKKRNGYILSEPEMFTWNDSSTDKQKTLVSEPANKDYNACIAWLSDETLPVLQPWRGHEQPGWEKMYLLQNPLLAIDPVLNTIKLAGEHWGYSIAEFLTTHPVYQQKINRSIGVYVDEEFQQVLYWASHGFRLGEILIKTGISKTNMLELLQRAWELDIAQAVPIDETGFRLQTLLGYQNYLPEQRENNLHSFWNNAVKMHAGLPWCSSNPEEVLTYEQAGELIGIIQKAIQAGGLKKGDSIMLCGELHTEMLLVFWAAVTMGIVVVPVSPKQAATRLETYVALIDPSLIVVEPELFTAFEKLNGPKLVMIDEPEHEQFNAAYSFENWLEAAMENESEIIIDPIEPGDTAVVLWTTGSTGNPKGIAITHAQLIRSGRLMTETYHWKKSDTYYALGGLETMSGLRHATVSIAEVGASCMLPVKNGSIYDHFNRIRETSVSIVTGNPAFFKQLLFAAKSNAGVQTLGVRLSLCTGNQLRQELRQDWQKVTGLKLYNYYGLTETSGICIAEALDVTTSGNNSIGVPVDCLVKVIDENGELVAAGEPGELCIYGAGVFNGYFKNDNATRPVLTDGWFHTRDEVIQDADGMLHLSGRLSDIIKLPSGDRIDVAALEEVMETIPGLTDWAVCPVVEGERESMAVFIVPNTPSDAYELTMQTRDTIATAIGLFAIPAIIEPVAHIPRGNHHKVLRKELTDSYLRTIN